MPSARRKYSKRSTAPVAAVQLNLDLDPPEFTYRKWGGVQTCKAGDWVVNNGGEVYTVDRESFAKTYSAAGPGIYRKVTPVWVEVAEEDGSINTKEGVTHYQKGWYLVFNNEDGSDGYAATPEAFHEMYVAAE